MSKQLAPEFVLERIEDWSDAEVEPLAGGLSNRSFLVTSRQRMGVLKIDDEPRDVPFNRRDAEAQIQRSAFDTGLASEPLYADRQCYLSEYVKGDVWQTEDLQSVENLSRLGKALRRLHALPLSGRTFDAPEAARVYLGQIGDRDTGKIEECVKIVDAMPSPMNLCLCHNDLVVGNIIDTGKVKFLDWEYACDNDPFFDLATVVAHHKLDKSRVDALLSSYFDGDWQQWRPQLERQVRNYDALLWLWEAARQGSSKSI